MKVMYRVILEINQMVGLVMMKVGYWLGQVLFTSKNFMLN